MCELEMNHEHQLLDQTYIHNNIIIEVIGIETKRVELFIKP